MQMTQAQTLATHDAISILDDLIPLRGASHTEVAEYIVEVPMRHAECHAVLQDGRKVVMAEPWKFTGWSSYEPNRSLLFTINGSRLELEVAEQLDGQAPGRVHNIILEAVALRCATTLRKFIGVDGDLMLLPA